MDKQIEIFNEAIMKVAPSAFYYEEQGKLAVLNEDSFTCDLYCAWKQCLKDHSIKDLIINKNLTKYFDSMCFGKIMERFPDENEHNFFHPDMVLHDSHGNDIQQIISCEIKRIPNANKDNVTKDINKLIIYMTPGSFEKGKKEFTYGAFILVGYEFDDLKGFIAKDKIPEIEKYWDKIYCFAYKSTSMDPKDIITDMDTLNNLLNDKKNE